MLLLTAGQTVVRANIAAKNLLGEAPEGRDLTAVLRNPDVIAALETAARELREETGYTGDAPETVGFVYANPAIMNNKAHTTVIRNAAKQYDTQLDAGEDLITRLVPLMEIPKLIGDGTISHSLMVAALCRFQTASG